MEGTSERRPWKAAYRYRGLVGAVLLLAAWSACFGYGIFLHPLRIETLPATVALVVALVLLNTGLFITAHDAIHGTLAPAHPRLNHAVGALCTFLYGGFSYSLLSSQHHRHHAHSGTAADPDFHDEKHPGFFAWYGRFFFHYFRWSQLAVILAIAVSMQVFLGVEQWNPLTFWALPGILSSFQLFFFGTFLPHRRLAVDPFLDRHRARSNDYPEWLSFLTCYHFGYHWEHHEHPGVPWWRLPQVRRERPAAGGGA